MSQSVGREKSDDEKEATLANIVVGEGEFSGCDGVGIASRGRVSSVPVYVSQVFAYTVV